MNHTYVASVVRKALYLLSDAENNVNCAAMLGQLLGNLESFNSYNEILKNLNEDSAVAE
jgi:hypothetical protein